MITELTALFSGQKRTAVLRERDAPEEETERQSQQLP
jgi:hypothetical protein